MARLRMIGLVLAIGITGIVLDRLFIHLIRWSVVGGWFISLGKAIQG